MHVEDHDLAHAGFEGMAGTGTVVVWDRGTWLNATRRDGVPISAADAVAAGHLRFVLEGERLNGGFALTQTRMGGVDRNWLLVKIADEYADRVAQPTVTENRSVISGLTNDDFRPDASYPDAAGASTSRPPTRRG